MRRKLSKKQIGAMGLAVMMGVQTPAMAAETSQEAATQETVAQETTQELQTTEIQTTETQPEESLAEKTEITEAQPEEVETTEAQTEETLDSVEISESETEGLMDQYSLTENQDVLEDGWHQDSDGNRTYVKNGEMVRDKVLQIDGTYYGFDEDGEMRVKNRFYMDGFYYYATADGSLYTNGWLVEDRDVYYYNADGKGSKGLCTIDGEQYYFGGRWDSGTLVMSMVVTADSGFYYCNADGKAHLLQNNQWYEGDNGYWYYVKDGVLAQNGTFKINGNWYKFDSDGKMLVEGENTNADGSLRINQWEYDGKCWHYYGEDGLPYTNGFFDIDGVKYHFSSNGILATSTVCFKSGEEDYYIADENGYLTKGPQNGWMLAGGIYYYAENGKLMRGTICKIGNAYYGFDTNGKMYADTDFSISDWKDGKYCTEYYHARSDGSITAPRDNCKSQWYQDAQGSWYYYDAEGKYVTGKVEVNGKVYAFDSDGKLKSEGIYSEDGSDYLVNENGEYVQTPGWSLVGSSWYYIKSDGTVYKGILENNGHTYYMQPQMATHYTIIVIDGIGYSIDSNGYMTTLSEGVYWQDGEQYYISNEGVLITGWQYIGSKWYYFSKQGGVYSNTDLVIDGKRYYFNADGAMENNGWILDREGVWYYAYASGELATGDTQINGVLYHFSEYGELRTGTIVEDGILKIYDEDGSLLGTGTSDGWNLIGGDYYYMNNGKLLTKYSYFGNGCELPDGNLYAFDSNGRMQVNKEIDGIWYGESGAAQKGWFQRGQTWYYADTITAVLYKGIHWINGKKYYFDENGVMLVGETVVDGKVVKTDDSGAIELNTEMKDGWSYYDGEWYYSKNGTPYTGWVGSYYIDFGHMVRDTIIMQYKYNQTYGSYEDEVYYYLDENGICKKNEWFDYGIYGEGYAKEDGSLANRGFYEIDGKTYYFGSCNGLWWKNYIKRTTPERDGNLFTEEGELIHQENYDQGWVLINGKWHYKDGTKFVYDEERKINGDSYFFDEHGSMVTGFAYKYQDFFTGFIAGGSTGRYYGADGKRCYYTGWQQLDGKWSYFDSNSEALVGWAMIGGIKYYFGDKDYGDNGDQAYVMTVGYRTIGEKLYYFDENGACQGVCGPQTGWYLADGNWYYMRGGRVVTGKTVVNHVEYEFDNDGIMIS